jgi:hypothetical protein
MNRVQRTDSQIWPIERAKVDFGVEIYYGPGCILGDASCCRDEGLHGIDEENKRNKGIIYSRSGIVNVVFNF